MIVMAFDENGQADTIERRKSICKRAYDLLIKASVDPEDIIFDPISLQWEPEFRSMINMRSIS